MRRTCIAGLAAFACSTAPALAQIAPADAPATSAEAPAATLAGAERHVTDAELAAIAMPDTAFVETAPIAADFDKYFYFQRDGTSFEEAYSDVRECDALASGISYYGGDGVNPMMFASQYGVLPSAIGGAIGSAIADAIVGSAERRRIRRINMRNCMGFKGYARFGLEKGKWQAFNFEEGFSREDAASRELALKQQALRASGPRPDQKALAL